MPNSNTTHEHNGELWAIRPEAVSQLRLRAAAITEDQAERMPLQTGRQGRVAVVPVSGPLVRDSSLWACCLQTYGEVRRAIEAAMEDDSVSAVLLDIDSPGGSVSGVEELGAYIAEAKAIKPIHAYTGGMATSAAYWIASQCTSITAAATADLGSIGVLLVHVDASELYKSVGLTVTYITAGRYKALGNEAEPLSDEARAYFEAWIGKTYQLFLSTVADGRQVSLDDAPQWAEGRQYLAAEALDMGLIDAVGTLDTAISSIMEDNMDIKTLQAKHPELYDQVRTVGAEEARSSMAQDNDTALANAKAEGVTQGRAEGVAFVAVALGQEASDKVKALMDSGMSPAQAQAARDLFGGGTTAKADPVSDAQAQALGNLAKATADPIATGADKPTGAESDRAAAVNVMTEAAKAVMGG